ncbi:hypothetical protein Pint_22641 [Pistacia integerrima]|uniref:Uncharacterized protein n=1 Tax=Pistacia integerrima TaxID=434235 RepID=A0ACC0YLQ1_9ROSI|nr:hypothetical protein Pint_22641 [Pistacia integerrima]
MRSNKDVSLQIMGVFPQNIHLPCPKKEQIMGPSRLNVNLHHLNCLARYSLEDAELIYGQVAGFSSRSTKIWKFGSCYILSHIHSFKLEGIANLII